MSEVFNQTDRKLLTNFVTDPTANVFAVKSWAMPGMVGAAYARYSRAKGGFRETLLREFIQEGRVDAAHANELIERILIAFGDDSVGELEGAHLSFENISVLATKEIEDRRIGGSPIEQSTRYVFYDQKTPEGQFRYYRPANVLVSEHGPLYLETMDRIFEIYSSLIEPLQEFYRIRKPLEAAEYDINGDGIKERWNDLTNEGDRKAFKRTYTTDLRTKACDTIRCLLPLATLTNVGIFGNGRFFQWLLTHLYTQPLPEGREIARSAQTALNEIIPQYVRRACEQPYRQAIATAMAELAAELTRDLKPETTIGIDLLDRGEQEILAALPAAPTKRQLAQAMERAANTLMLAAMLYPYTSHSLRQLRDRVARLPDAVRARIAETYVGNRQSRRDRPGRAFEIEYPYVFDCVIEFAVYKDLMRHRMNTQLRQPFSTRLGFLFPDDLREAGLADRAEEAIDRAGRLYERLLPDFPLEAQYAVLHGHYIRWVLGINDRALHHMLELRTTPQGHPNYRKACQRMYELVAARNPARAAVMKFVDFGDYQWARADSEARQRAKEHALDSKYGSTA